MRSALLAAALFCAAAAAFAEKTFTVVGVSGLEPSAAEAQGPRRGEAHRAAIAAADGLAFLAVTLPGGETLRLE